MKNPLIKYEDLTIKGFKRFGFSLGDGLNTQEHSQKGNFDPLASFGSPRNQQIITILLSLIFLSMCFL
ncbi:unnamed protein product [Eruca vesicaria subsp. sativa]|uniref:Uncharacterized protein n=1 Tax=Eruca vesicaria subsp. sativa TaxID=29727 RepID=A0ABC8LQC1_ERUVS|nr:unnamed protein product [Eruca vesicaria subsp. sativa]